MKASNHHSSSISSSHDNQMPPPPPVVSGPLRSVEGWVTFVTGVNEEAIEEDIREAFCDYGRIKSIVLNADRKTGLAKGYALVEYMERNEAQDAINALHGKSLMGKKIGMDNRIALRIVP